MKKKRFLFVLISVLLFSCKQDATTLESSEAIDEDDIFSTLDPDLITNEPIQIQPKVLDPDSILPPEIIQAGDPIIQQAHSNIKNVEQPIIKLLGANLPTFTIGQDSILQPVVKVADGQERELGYNEPVISSKFDFNDAASYNIQGIDVDQGLSSSYIMDMIEDKRGNLWFSTWTAGVTMYNGRTFIQFDESKGLRSNYIWTIHEDKQGRIWFGTDGSGISAYNGHTFIEYDQEDGLASDLVLDIAEDEDGNIWFATGEGLSMFDGETFTSYGTDQGMSGDFITSVAIDKNGDVWCGIAEGGVNRFDGEGFTHFTENEGLISNNVTKIYLDSEENLWVGTEASGICLYDGYSFITYQEEMGLSNNYIRSIIEDNYGNMWFGTDEGGACMFNRFEFKNFTDIEGMSNNSIWSLLEDSDGNIWFGTFGSGANVYNERSFENYSEKQGLNDHIVRDIYQDQEGYLWFTTNNGVSKYDGKTFQHYTEEQGLGLNKVRAMHQDMEGNYWFATDGNGVSKFDGETFTNYNTTNGMSGDNVLCIYENELGDLWFGTYLDGITRYDGYTFSHFTEEQGLANNTVQSIIQDSIGRMYFGTKGAGLTIFDGQNITNYTTREGLSDNFVISLHEDSEGTIWVGTEGSGLNKFATDTIISYDTKDGLSNNIIWSIIEDNNGELWLGTEKGLNNFSIDDSLGVVITNFGKLDGIKGSDFYPNSVCLDDENRLWWGTGKALAMLDLTKYEQIKKPPYLQITDIRLDQTFVDYRKLKDSTRHDHYLSETSSKKLNPIKFTEVEAFTNTPKELELPYYLNHVTFYFSGIDWSAPHKVRYQYKLQGHNDEWSPILSDNKAVYTNIPSGEYLFKVRAIGDSKIWSNEIAYHLVIHPPWWETWWAYTLYVILGALIIFLVIRFRTKQLLENQRHLESVVTQRTYEVVKQKELVEYKNKEITDSITYAQRIQNAILPTKHLIGMHLNETFFYYRPKDIVAGDFYWLETSDKNEVLLAAADCTGHGVPGAMVSVVCNNALNRTVREFKLHSPADILNKVRDLVIETFQTSETEVKDGMDIALVSINKKTNVVTYAGANNDLYIVRNGELEIITADKQPIGRYVAEKDFTEHSIQLKKGDCIYVFTDGYMDQFGGPKGKKFKYSAFRNMIIEIHDKPMEEQEAHINKVFNQWMGRLEQLDDICVIGVRI
ncbi:MAG: ligand-binding sensor domain-containing protein [Arenicella sp.]